MVPMKLFLVLGSVYGFLGVVLGAFGAHALKTRLSTEMFQIFEVGVRYHMYHTLALLIAAWAVSQYKHPLLLASGWFFALGIFVFSGSLYILALSGVKIWGAVTPLGGLLFLMGWLTFGVGILKS